MNICGYYTQVLSYSGENIAKDYKKYKYQNFT